MKPIYMLLTVALAATNLFAFDFTAPDTNGNTIYYNIVGGDSVEGPKTTPSPTLMSGLS